MIETDAPIITYRTRKLLAVSTCSRYYGLASVAGWLGGWAAERSVQAIVELAVTIFKPLVAVVAVLIVVGILATAVEDAQCSGECRTKKLVRTFFCPLGAARYITRPHNPCGTPQEAGWRCCQKVPGNLSLGRSCRQGPEK